VNGHAISTAATQDFEHFSSGTINQRGPTPAASLLVQLKMEPTSDLERAAKFALYDAYSAEVEDMRNTIVKLHESSRPLLPESLAISMCQQIHALDSREAMSIPERTVEWFVYHMMHKAEQNNLRMASKLDAFEKRIKYLAENCQTECPVCLETFHAETKIPETLGCCHKICRDCWTRWSTVMHGLKKHPFCPCCNHCEFIGTVRDQVGGGGGGVDLSDSDGDVFSRTCSMFTPGGWKGSKDY